MDDAATPDPTAGQSPRRAHDLYDDDTDGAEHSRIVRPYTRTRGRTRPGRGDLPLEALVSAVSGASDPAATSERRGILELTGESMLSIAELSAHLSLPLGVVRVVVGDLADQGLVTVHTGSPTSANPATDLKVLESVLNGISAL